MCSMSRVLWDWSQGTRHQWDNCLLCLTQNIPKRPNTSPIKISSHNKISSQPTKTSLMNLTTNSDPWPQVSHCRGWNWTVLILTSAMRAIYKTIIKITAIYSFARMDKNKMSIKIKRNMLAKITQMRKSKNSAVRKVMAIGSASTSLLRTLFN